jgi:hypothetical protein
MPSTENSTRIEGYPKIVLPIGLESITPTSVKAFLDYSAKGRSVVSENNRIVPDRLAQHHQERLSPKLELNENISRIHAAQQEKPKHQRSFSPMQPSGSDNPSPSFKG